MYCYRCSETGARLRGFESHLHCLPVMWLWTNPEPVCVSGSSSVQRRWAVELPSSGVGFTWAKVCQAPGAVPSTKRVLFRDQLFSLLHNSRVWFLNLGMHVLWQLKIFQQVSSSFVYPHGNSTPSGFLLNIFWNFSFSPTYLLTCLSCFLSLSLFAVFIATWF